MSSDHRFETITMKTSLIVVTSGLKLSIISDSLRQYLSTVAIKYLSSVIALRLQFIRSGLLENLPRVVEDST